MGAASGGDFEAAIAQAKADGDLSRGHVVRLLTGRGVTASSRNATLPFRRTEVSSDG